MELTFDNQIVRTSKIGLAQPNRPLCIHVIVNNMIIIKCQMIIT